MCVPWTISKEMTRTGCREHSVSGKEKKHSHLLCVVISRERRTQSSHEGVIAVIHKQAILTKGGGSYIAA